MTTLAPDLTETVEEARRHEVPGLTWHIQEKGEEKRIVFEMVADHALDQQRLTNAPYAFCDERGYRRRFLIVRSTPAAVRSQPPMPDNWPPEGAAPQ